MPPFPQGACARCGYFTATGRIVMHAPMYAFVCYALFVYAACAGGDVLSAALLA